jgi:hypothetical protein
MCSIEGATGFLSSIYALRSSRRMIQGDENTWTYDDTVYGPESRTRAVNSIKQT